MAMIVRRVALVAMLTAAAGVVPAPAAATEGCTPGYWKQDQHLGNWRNAAPADSFASVFGSRAGSGSLLDRLGKGGGGDKALGRHAVAAWLNAAATSVDYPLTTEEVEALVIAALGGNKTAINAAKNRLAALNEAGCPLGRAETRSGDDDDDGRGDGDDDDDGRGDGDDDDDGGSGACKMPGGGSDDDDDDDHKGDSDDDDDNNTDPFCNMTGNGCEPVYWATFDGTSYWPPGTDPQGLWDFLPFDNAFPGRSQFDVLIAGGPGALDALGSAVLAAFFNASRPELDYPFTTTQVVDLFNNVFPGTDAEYQQVINGLQGLTVEACTLPPGGGDFPI